MGGQLLLFYIFVNVYCIRIAIWLGKKKVVVVEKTYWGKKKKDLMMFYVRLDFPIY